MNEPVFESQREGEVSLDRESTLGAIDEILSSNSLSAARDVAARRAGEGTPRLEIEEMAIVAQSAKLRDLLSGIEAGGETDLRIVQALTRLLDSDQVPVSFGCHAGRLVAQANELSASAQQQFSTGIAFRLVNSLAAGDFDAASDLFSLLRDTHPEFVADSYFITALESSPIPRGSQDISALLEIYAGFPDQVQEKVASSPVLQSNALEITKRHFERYAPDLSEGKLLFGEKLLWCVEVDKIRSYFSLPDSAFELPQPPAEHRQEVKVRRDPVEDLIEKLTAARQRMTRIVQAPPLAVSPFEMIEAASELNDVMKEVTGGQYTPRERQRLREAIKPDPDLTSAMVEMLGGEEGLARLGITEADVADPTRLRKVLSPEDLFRGMQGSVEEALPEELSRMLEEIAPPFGGRSGSSPFGLLFPEGDTTSVPASGETEVEEADTELTQIEKQLRKNNTPEALTQLDSFIDEMTSRAFNRVDGPQLSRAHLLRAEYSGDLVSRESHLQQAVESQFIYPYQDAAVLAKAFEGLALFHQEGGRSQQSGVLLAMATAARDRDDSTLARLYRGKDGREALSFVPATTLDLEARVLSGEL